MQRHSTWTLLILTLAAIGGLSCSGQRNDETTRRLCTADAECGAGQSCKAGLCVQDDPSIIGGGEIRASGVADGASAVVSVVSEGGTCADSACTVTRGATVTFTAPTVNGYRFNGWSGDPGCQGEGPTLVLVGIDSDVDCVAQYVKRVRVTGASDAPSELIAATASGRFASCIGSSCEVDTGETVTLTAPERDGMRFTSWSGEGCPAATSPQLQIIAEQADVVCTAGYTAAFLVRTTVEGAELVIDVSSTTPGAACTAGQCRVDAGGEVTLSAPALAGHRFAGFSGPPACESSAQTLSITPVGENLDCVGRYVRRFNVEGTAQGATPVPALTATSSDTFASCQGNRCEVDQGGAASLSAPTVSGYRLVDWQGADCAAQQGAAVNFTSVDHDITCTARYVLGVAVSGGAQGASATITAQSSSPGAMCSGPSCVIDVGGTVTLTVGAATGFRFTGWTGDPGCASSATSITLSQVSGSRTCIAGFTPLRYRVTGAVAPTPGGRVTAASTVPSATCSGSACTINHGSEVTLTAVPNTGYTFTRWSGCSTTATTPTLRVTNVVADQTCTANFQINRYTVTTASAPANGGSATTSCGGSSCQVDHGGSVTVTAVPATGYVFSGWVGCASGATNPLPLTNITSDRACTANFTLRQLNVSSNSLPAAGGSASCAGSGCSVAYGGTVALSATPATGYEFRGWSGCNTGTANPLNLGNVTSNLVCTANFALRRVTVTPAASPSAGGSAACSTGGCSTDYGGSVSVRATAATGYDFSGWSGCATGRLNPLPLSNLTRDVTCTANFTRQRFTVTPTVAPAGAGTVSCGAGCTVDHGGTVSLTASAATGYVFTSWSGCQQSQTNPLTVSNVVSDQTCIANFARRSFSLSVDGQSGADRTVSLTSPGASCANGVCTATVSYGGSFTFRVTYANGRGVNPVFINNWGAACPGATTTPVAVGVFDVTIPNVTSQRSCAASYDRGYAASIYISSTVFGTVTPSPNRAAYCDESNPNGTWCTYPLGTTSTFTFNTAAGHTFFGWICARLPYQGTAVNLPPGNAATLSTTLSASAGWDTFSCYYTAQ